MKDLNITIRKARLSDVEGIFQLVKELAIYEKAENEVTVDPDYYTKAFSDGLFESIVAIHDDRVIGTCIYYPTFSTWKGKMLYLEDFVVRENYRQHGIGQQLYNQLEKIAKSEQYNLMKWQVLDWNDPAIRFYEKNNATIEKEWWNCKVVF